MDAIVPTRRRHGTLPKITTSKELSRRDSLSSSRTRDSGYNSDLDVSFSPFDYVDCEQHLILARVPSIPDAVVCGNIPPVEPPRTIQDVSTSIKSSTTNTLVAACNLPKIVQFSLPTSPSQQSNAVVDSQNIEEWMKDNLPSHNRPSTRVSSITSLSSATSCELYTDTDMSDDQHEPGVHAPPSTIPGATVRTINLIMRKIELQLRYTAIQCNGGRTSTSTHNNGSVPQQTTRKASQSSGKRKARPDDDMRPNDDEEDGFNKRRRSSLATIESSEAGARFACPFYKHEPHRFRNRRTCPGPGWPTVHRMKEHLYRAHAQSIYCPRCYATFDADVDLSNHLRSAQCNVSAPQPVEGIDRETLKALRKRTPALRLEEDKWRDVYHLLFPNVDLADIPSPFYDADAPSESSRRFRRELLQRIQQELVTTAGRLPDPVEHQLLQQVANIIRRCEEDLLSSFDNSMLAVPSLSGRRASDTSTVSTWSAQHTPHHATPMHSDLNVPAPTSATNFMVTDSMHADGSGLLEEAGHQRVATEHQEGFRSIMWAQPNALDPISEWMESDVIIAPPEDICGDEAFADFSVGMWN